VSDPLPPQTTFQSCATTAGACTSPAVGTNGTVRVDIPSLGSGGDVTITIVVAVNAPGGGAVTNTVNVTSVTPDPVTTNNSASTTTTVNP
jgi:hypothetical protein